MKLAIIVPAYNEEAKISSVLKDLQKIKINGISKSVIVVNDGSVDNTKTIANNNCDYLLNHAINRGLGAALATGLEFAKRIKSDLVVTFDADGQHRANDVQRVLSPILQNKADFVVGSRLKKNSKMPLDRKIINFCANLFTFLLWGIWITDTQSGLRAMNRKSLKVISIRMNKMEVSSEFIKEVKKNKLRLKEVAIPAIYNDYTREKGQKNSNAINIIVKLLIYKFIK